MKVKPSFSLQGKYSVYRDHDSIVIYKPIFANVATTTDQGLLSEMNKRMHPELLLRK